jgi:hypothetical protein
MSCTVLSKSFYKLICAALFFARGPGQGGDVEDGNTGNRVTIRTVATDAMVALQDPDRHSADVSPQR